MPAVRLPEDSAEFATDDTSKTLLNIPALILDDELVPAITSPETADDDELLQSVAKSDDVVMTEKSPVIVAETAQDPDRTLIAMPVITAEMLGEIPQVESDDIAKTQINLPALDIAIPAEPISLDEDKTLISMPSITDDQLLSAGTFQQESVTDFDSTLTFDAEALLGDMTFELRKPKPKADVVDIPAQTPVSEIGAMEATQDEVAPEETAEPDMMQATVRLEADTPASELIEHPDIDAAAGETVRVTVEAVVPDIEAVVESEAVAESQTAATIVAAARPVFADMPVDDHDQDDEIREIFIEEATEVLETIHEFFPKWAANFDNKNALTEFRRGFHTLKGSGRMVGAKVVGELAWSIENMLNRVIDKTATPNAAMCQLIERVLDAVPGLIENYNQQEAPGIHTVPLMDVADRFARGQSPSAEDVEQAVIWSQGQTDVVPSEPVAAELASTESEAEELPAEALPTVSVEIPTADAPSEPEAFEETNVIEEETPVVEAVAEALPPVFETEIPAMPMATGVDVPTGVAMPEDDFSQDDEIREIFIEEAEEVLETIREYFPKWAANFGNKSALTEFRRGFHTLKGSGRMVGAKVIGELAWSIENMLNRVIDNTATASGDMCALIEGVIAVVPEMIESFKNSEATTLNTSPVMSVAFEFAAGRPLSKAVIDAAFAMATGAVVSPAVEEAPVAAEAVQAAPETSKPETTTTAAGDEDLSDAFEALATSLEEVEPVEASALAFDPVLMEIFVSEANTYLDEIEQFLKETPATAKVPVTDEVLRALHTLRGSAGMAGVKTVSGLAAPMEGLFKDLRQQGRLINPVHMELLENVYRLIRQSISSVAEGGTGLVSGDTPLIARIEQVSRAPASEEEIALAVDAPANTAGIVAGFMELELDHLLDAPWELSGWLAGEDRAGHVATLLHELEVLTPAAISSGVQPLVSLLAALQAVYGFIASDIDASIANEALMEDIGNAHDELINIFDTLAACQTVVPNDALIASLRGWTGVEDAPVAEPVPAPVVMAPVPVTRAAVEIDNGADPELLSIFLEEGEEVLLAAEEEFRNWLADSDNKNALRALQRHLHTLKGARAWPWWPVWGILPMNWSSFMRAWLMAATTIRRRWRICASVAMTESPIN